MKRLLAALLLLAGPSHAASLPRYVAGPLSGFDLECKQAGQRSPAIVSEIPDLDGDGSPDHIIETGKSCAAVKLLYCNAEGCLIDIFLSTFSGNAGGYHAKRVRVVQGKPALLEVVADGPACGKPAGQDCISRYAWDKDEFKPR